MRSLPSSKAHAGYDARGDLVLSARRQCSTDAVVATLKNVFWEKMFTQRNEERLWRSRIFGVFPQLEPNITAKDHCRRINQDLEHTRRLRNRIAHHEPIFARDLRADLHRIEQLVDMRCVETCRWMTANECVSGLLATFPLAASPKP